VLAVPVVAAERQVEVTVAMVSQLLPLLVVVVVVVVVLGSLLLQQALIQSL
jgi:hypothetical protein